MNVDELRRKLIAAARENPPSDRVPHAFHKRITAQLAARPLPDNWALWARALWRGAAACVAVSLVCTAWTFYATTLSGSAADFSQQFENTLLAAADQEQSADIAQ